MSRAKLIRMGLLGLLLLSSACSTTPQPLVIRSDIDALATQTGQTKRHFAILPANQGTNPLDLQFLEFKGYIEKVLQQRGYVKVDDMQQGDVVLFLNYGVGEPQLQQYSYDVPVWSDFAYYPYGRRYRFYPRMSYGVVGYAQQMATYSVYRRYLTLEAYDMAAYLQKQAPQQLWKISVQSQGQSNDLRLAFPYMVAAMQPYLGSNTGHMITVDIEESNPLLKDLLLGNPNRLPASGMNAPPFQP